MQVTEMSLASVFGSISHVDYVCSYEKGSKKNVRDSYINPAVYLIHTYYSTVHKEKKKANERKRNTIVYWSVTLGKQYSQLMCSQ